jgi:hypothetical protein
MPHVKSIFSQFQLIWMTCLSKRLHKVGLLTIESDDGETGCIHTHSRGVLKSSLKVPLSAATVLDLTGKQYLHGYMNHRFRTTSKRHQLVARARQFSSFIMIVGNMIDASTLDPNDAVIVQNKVREFILVIAFLVCLTAQTHTSICLLLHRTRLLYLCC